jgi:hypothetical protein
MRVVPLAVVAGLLLAACQADPGKKDIQTQAGDIAADTGVMKAAEAAANDIVRNSTDCDAVKANLAETNRKLDEAQARVRTEAGRTTLEVLKTQVRNVAQACP